MKRDLLKKGILVIMTLSMILSLLGCGKGGRTIIKHQGGKNQTGEEFGEDDGMSGNDFSEDGSAEYKKLVAFAFGESGYMPGYSYNVRDGVLTYEDREKCADELVCPVDDAVMVEVSELFAKLNIKSWDRFDRSNDYVLDGSGFSLSAEFEDGTTISASGSNAFPKNFSEFATELRKIMEPTVSKALETHLEDNYKAGKYDGPLEFTYIMFKDRGASGNDEYSFILWSQSGNNGDFEIDVTNESGDFADKGTYKYMGNYEKSDEVLARIQEVLEKYEVYKWDGYDESTDDYNDREWFQMVFDYADTSINCCGCGDTEHYEDVRKELLTILMECAVELGSGE